MYPLSVHTIIHSSKLYKIYLCTTRVYQILKIIWRPTSIVHALSDALTANDTCHWPPPYDPWNCTSIANQEFSLTDLLNMGIRAIELDNWFCDGEVNLYFSFIFNIITIYLITWSHLRYAHGIKGLISKSIRNVVIQNHIRTTPPTRTIPHRVDIGPDEWFY